MPRGGPAGRIASGVWSALTAICGAAPAAALAMPTAETDMKTSGHPAPLLLALVLLRLPAPLLAQPSGVPGVTESAIALGSGAEMRYAISLPPEYAEAPDAPRPLVLALHPGGRSVYYGSWFMQSIVEPALRDWDAVIVAPDVPARSWSVPESERAVLALLADVTARHAIDPDRVLVTGFSMGGAGTWYLAARNPDLFTGAIAVAARPAADRLDSFGQIPVYLIHSPDDEVVPYEPVEAAALELGERGSTVELLRLPGATHYDMGAYVGPIRRGGEWIRERWDETAGGPAGGP